MSNTFEIIGRLGIGKESEKFKPYSETTSAKGWVSTRLVFNAISGDNRFTLEVKGGHFKDGSGKVFAFSKGGTTESGERIKGEKLEIAWKDRLNPEILENVAEFKKLVVDLEEYGKRYKLEKAVEKSKDGSLTDEELVALGIEDPIKALEDSKKKRREFIAESDYAEYILKLIKSGKINDKLFRIHGDIVYTEYNGKFYKRFAPTRIYLAEKDVQPSSMAQITVFFNKDSLDEKSLKDTKKYYINGYVRNYDNQRKEDIPCPVQLVIDTNKDDTDEKNKKLNTLMVKQFTIKDKSWKELGVKVKLLDGAQKTELTDDMLTDFQKEMIELGAMTKEDVIKELGGDIYGERVEEMVVINVARGYSKGRKDTVYIDDDFVIKAIELDEDKNSTDNSSEDDIFDLDDIDI